MSNLANLTPADRVSRLFGDAVIPTLEPYGLHIVPGYDPQAEDPDSFRERYFVWRDDIYNLREHIDRFLRNNPSEVADERYLCAHDKARWLTLWAWLEEPRNELDAEGFLGARPFVPFAGQVKLMERFDETMADKVRDLYVSKSRGWGASWMFCAIALWGWLYQTPWRVKMLSRNKELVWNRGDMDALFSKIEFIMDYLPGWQFPQRWKIKENLLKNFDTGAQIAGATTTTDSARGGRATWMFYDEGAFMESFRETWGTGGGSTYHRIGVSTESFEKGDDWYMMWTEMKVSKPSWVLELDYQHNPAFDSAWEKQERERLVNDPEKFALEYERNPYTGDDWIYPTARDLPVETLLYDPSKILGVALDPGRADDTAVVWGQPIERGGARGVAWLESYERTLMGPHWYAHILTGIDPVPGDVAYSDWISQGGWTERERQIVAFTRTLPWSADYVRYFMDPAGTQKHVGHEDFHTLLYKESLRLRKRALEQNWSFAKGKGPAVGIYCFYRELQGNKGEHEHRRTVTRAYLPYMVFNDTYGGRRVRECLHRSRFSNPTEQAIGQPAPVHGKFSHVRSAVEYFCAYAAMGFADVVKRLSKAERAEQRRQKKSRAKQKARSG